MLPCTYLKLVSRPKPFRRAQGVELCTTWRDVDYVINCMAKRSKPSTSHQCHGRLREYGKYYCATASITFIVHLHDVYER